LLEMREHVERAVKAKKVIVIPLYMWVTVLSFINPFTGIKNMSLGFVCQFTSSYHRCLPLSCMLSQHHPGHTFITLKILISIMWRQRIEKLLVMLFLSTILLLLSGPNSILRTLFWNIHSLSLSHS
jgi:hypothetical protein